MVFLPEEPRNRSWYSNWVMLLASERNTAAVPFVQVGLIREHPKLHYLCAFLAFQTPGQALVYRNLGNLAEGEHPIGIAGDSDKLRLLIDHRTVHTFDRRAFFYPEQRPYLQFATEVHSPNDRAAGYLRDIEVKNDRSAKAQHLKIAGVWQDRVGLTYDSGRYSARGLFNPSR